MSLSTKLETLLGAEAAKEVIEIVKSQDAMKKYMATDKGKAAKKRANQNFLVKHGRQLQYQNDTKQDVLRFLGIYMGGAINDAIDQSCSTDEENLAWIESQPSIYRTGSEMWKSYKEWSGSKLTRCRFLTLLPTTTIIPYIVREGKKVYTPAYKFPIMDYLTCKNE